MAHRLEDDRHVGRVEELDRVRLTSAARCGASRPKRKVDLEALEVDDETKDEDGRHEVGDVGQVLAVEGLLERANLILLGDKEVEKGNHGALELGTAAGVDGGRRKRLPDDALTDGGSDEKRNARADAVALLQELVEADHDDT